MSTPAPGPDPDLHTLQPVLGTWDVMGDATGRTRYEWLEGNFFLAQHFDLVHNGRTIRGTEIIGHLYPFAGRPSPDIYARVYSCSDGMTLDYVYELDGDTLTIWAGHRGSPSFYRGTFSADGIRMIGAWHASHNMLW